MEWHGDQLEKAIADLMAKNLVKAAIHLKVKIKEKINRAEPYKRTTGTKGVYYRGLDPSKPNEPPKKVRGDLQRSIAHELADDKQSARVGTNLASGAALEFGTETMEPRPYLRATLIEEREAIARILAAGTT